MDCARDVLDQGTLDAIATHIPNASAMSIAQLFASRDENLEFMSCSFTSSTRAENGMPMAMVRYQHDLNDRRLEWCKPEPAAIADEYTFDEETDKGLMALVRPGMKGGRDGAPLMPQRTGWACSEDGTEMVSITFGAMEGYGDANEGLTAIENSRKDQTLNTPAVATLVLMAEQIEWMNQQGGLAWADARTRETSGLLYDWASHRSEITPFVGDPAARSQVVTTLDVDEDIDATAITAVLRAHGVVDVEPYRKLGRNQLRIATFPAVPPEDVRALISVLDHVLDTTA